MENQYTSNKPSPLEENEDRRPLPPPAERVGTDSSPLGGNEGGHGGRGGLEIERKFLVTGEYKHLAASSTHIQQAYIASGNGRTVRVRIRDEKAYLTIKGPGNHSGAARYEFEMEIPMADALDLMKIAEPGVIDKRRYLVPFVGHTFEVDEFYGENEGLTMAEVELEAEDEHVELPGFIGREVTGDRRFYNSHMRRYPYSQWKDSV